MDRYSIATSLQPAALAIGTPQKLSCRQHRAKALSCNVISNNRSSNEKSGIILYLKLLKNRYVLIFVKKVKMSS